MKLLLVVISLLSCGSFILCQQFTKVWYDLKLIEYVVPSFRSAYITLQQDVLGLVLKNALTEDSESIMEFGSNLTCAVKSVRHNLYLATNGSQRIQVEVNHKLIDTAAAISAKESEILSKEKDIRQKSIEVNNLQQLVARAEQGVKDKEVSLQKAQESLQAAEDNVKNARNCFSGRRKRWDGGIRRIGNVVVQIVKKIEEGICGVLNYEGIQTAKDARRNAETNLQETRNTLDSYRNQLETVVSQRKIAEIDLEQLRLQLQAFNSVTNTLRTFFASVSSMDKELKLVMTSINNVWDASRVLYTALMGIVDFNLVIGPLNDIFIQLTKNSLLSRIPIKLMTDEEILQGKEILMKVSDVLSKMPLNTDSIDAKCSTK